ncbi:hypothetical protein BC830DRAFT_723491 [Chytriomyces sp. MP71]|nr:hypothetical protein BC830DRAFT_723491 [Chytriomyces sp. MP71]
MSLKQNVFRAKHPQGKMSSKKHIPRQKCPQGKMSRGKSVAWARCPWGKMSSRIMSQLVTKLFWEHDILGVDLAWGLCRGNKMSPNKIYSKENVLRVKTQGNMSQRQNVPATACSNLNP